MPKSDIDVLRHMLMYIAQIDEAHAEFGRDYKRFCESNTYKNSVAMCIFQIGELSHHLSEEFKTNNTSIPWKQVRGMRNIVAHEYARIDPETLWDTLETDIPVLYDFCSEQLQTLAPEQIPDNSNEDFIPTM